MAGRVNKKFVITLVSVLVGVFGLLAAAYLVLAVNSPAKLASKGDQYMTAKQYDKAQEYYSKAVNKEQTNAIYLEKWRESLRKLNPENRVTYRDLVDRWTAATKQLAKVKKDVGAQREYLDLLGEQISDGEFNRAAQEAMIKESSVLIALHKGEPAGGPWETLKRYRGRANFEIYNFVRDAKPEVAKEAESDLAAALAADPSDTETAIALQNFYLVQSARATERSMLDEAKQLEEKARAVRNDAAAKNPKDATIHLAVIGQEINDRFRAFSAEKNPDADVVAWVKRLQSELHPRLAEAMDMIRAMDGAKITLPLVTTLRGVESRLDATNKLPFTEEAISLALAKQPSNPSMIAAKADLLSTREEFQAASDALQQLLDLPMPATSLDGLRLFMMRTSARFYQAYWTARLATAAKDADRTRLLNTAKSLREKLVAVEAQDAPTVLLVDAQVAFAEGDFGRANQLLDRHWKATRSRPNPEALVLQAMVADKINQLGLAKDKLDECLKLQPSNVRAMYMLADVETRLQNSERAIQLYQLLRRMMPDDKLIESRLQILAQMSGANGVKVSDPVIADLIELRDIVQTKPDEKDRSAEAVPFLRRKIVERNQDPRLVQQLALLLAGQGNRDEALAVLKTGIAAHADATDLKDLEIALSNPDPVSGRLKIIDSKEAPPLDKTLARYQILRDAGRDKEAAAEMSEAVKLNEKDPRVVEFRFLDAIQAADWPLAQQLTDVASKANQDDAGGLTFKARLLGAQGKNAESLAAINEAVGKGGALPEVWRIKGRVELAMGRNADAVESYGQALRLRPTDVNCINDSLEAMIRAGRNEEALKLAKESEKYASGSEKFVNVWLSLEAQLGSKRYAIDRREAIARSSPKDRGNLIALASLYIGDRNWAAAKPLIDRARAIEDGTDILSLDAAWHWEQGEREQARALFESFIAKVPADKLSAYQYLIYAQFLANREDDEGALAVLDKARSHQNAKDAEADKAIVDVLMKSNRFDKTIDVCRRIITAGADTSKQLYRMRLVESLAKIGNYADAEKELSLITGGIEADATTMLLMAEIKAGLKDVRGQKDLLDRAVTKFPDSPMVFFKRGQALASDARTAREAISDFNKAIQLNPNMWQALRMRGLAHIQLNQMDEAESDLAAAVQLAPYNDELVYGLISDLLRKGETARASDIATNVLAKRDRDLRAITTIGSLFASSQSHVEAAKYLKLAFELEKSDLIAQRYLDSLLASSPPNNTDAGAVLTALGEQRVRSSPGFLMAVAKLSRNVGRLSDANVAASDALKLLQIDDPTQMLAWFNDLRRLLPRKEDLLRYLSQTSKMTAVAKSQEWLEYFQLSVNLEDPSTTAQTIAPARDLLGRTNDASIKQLLFRSVSGAIFARGDYQEAIKVMREGLGQFPNDAEMLNNGAYCLADKLGNPQDAVPMIEKVVENTPGVADVWDTYGLVYSKLGQLDKAADGYRKAVSLASGPTQAVKFVAPLIQVMAKSGRKDEARNLVRDFKPMVEDSRNQISEDLRKKFEEAAASVDAAK
jgi:tetratricopeptide (TPR) repeat protein